MLRLLALTLTRPELLNGPASMADATVVSQFRVPALLKVPLPEKFVMALALLVLTLKVLPDALLSVALLSRRSRPAVRLALPLLFQVRALRTLSPAPLTVDVLSVVSCPTPLTVPLLQFKAPDTVRLPAPVSVPPLMERDPLNADAPARVRLPPDNTKFSSTVSWLATIDPEDAVMVWEPATLIATFCPAVGTVPVLQFAPVFQSPDVPIQQTSTTQENGNENTAAVAP